MDDVNSIEERQFVVILISLYREYPVLWQIKSKDYTNKHKRSAALADIVCTLRKYKPDFTEEKLKKKINSLRTNFNKEFQKIERQRLSGEILIPTLWYYNDLLFIKDQGVVVPETQILEIKHENEVIEEPLEKQTIKRAKRSVRENDQHLTKEPGYVTSKAPDEFQIFGDYVASELRNLRCEENQRKLKIEIQRAILRANELDVIQCSSPKP